MAILVVSDDPELRASLAFALRRAGYAVRAASEGGTRTLWQSNTLELALLDLDLPNLRGWELCAQLRDASATPVLLLTGAPLNAAIVTKLALAAVDCMVKPVPLPEVLARVRTLLRGTEAPTGQPTLLADRADGRGTRR